MAQKLFRDPLYDYISIDRDQHAWLLDLVNCPELQRLRFISQLGLCQFTYPGSTHSRFSHSLGVMHLMMECLAHLKQGHRKYFKPLDEEALLAAALLHDVGHGPFSHATEGVFGDHEARGVAIIRDPSSEVHKVLSKRAAGLPPKVAALLEKGSQAPLWQKSLISSQLDLDRLDYLRRDSLYSGAEYGNFDCFRITHTMELRRKTIGGKQQGLFVVWPDKSKFAIEEYLFSRFYMYQSVYFHHTTRGYEGLLDRVLTRARDMARDSTDFTAQLLAPLRVLACGTETPSPRDFQGLTDHVLLAQITLWQECKDGVLQDLCRRLLTRQGIGWAEAAAGTPFEMTSKIGAVRDYLTKQGKDSKYYFIEHVPHATPYRPYSSGAAGEEQTSVNSIMLYGAGWPGTGFCEISQVSGLQRLQAITGAQPTVLRYYFPKEHEIEIRKLLKG
jgi:HD superfamily phosphohydrolase